MLTEYCDGLLQQLAVGQVTVLIAEETACVMQVVNCI